MSGLTAWVLRTRPGRAGPRTENPGAFVEDQADDSELLVPPEVPVPLDPFGGVSWPEPGPPGPRPGPHPPAMPEVAFPATRVSMDVVPSVVAVLNATLSPTAR